MTRRTIVTLIVLAVILGAIFLIQRLAREREDTTNAVLSATAFNQTKNADAATAQAAPRDVVIYTLKAENPSDRDISGFVFEASIADITELATLIDAQGANYNSSTNSLAWTPQDIPAKGSVEKKFTVRIKDSIPANSDLTASFTFGNEVKVAVSRSQVATNDGNSQQGGNYVAPSSGIPLNIAFMLAVCATFGIFLFRLAHKLGRPQ